MSLQELCSTYVAPRMARTTMNNSIVGRHRRSINDVSTDTNWLPVPWSRWWASRRSGSKTTKLSLEHGRHRRSGPLSAPRTPEQAGQRAGRAGWAPEYPRRRAAQRCQGLVLHTRSSPCWPTRSSALGGGSGAAGSRAHPTPPRRTVRRTAAVPSRRIPAPPESAGGASNGPPLIGSPRATPGVATRPATNAQFITFAVLVIHHISIEISCGAPRIVVSCCCRHNGVIGPAKA